MFLFFFFLILVYVAFLYLLSKWSYATWVGDVIIVARMMLLGGVGIRGTIVGIAVRCLTIGLFSHTQEFFLRIVLLNISIIMFTYINTYCF